MSASDSSSPALPQPRPRGRFSVLAHSVSAWADAHSAIVFSLLTAWYAALVWNPIRRPLWFDELSTFYIAQQPTVARMMEAIRNIDLNPPLNYFLTRWSLHLFGPTPWAARLPGAVAFWGGSLAIFIVLRRRASAIVASIGVLLFWCSPYLQYSVEARPYGLLLGLTAVLVAAWDHTHRKSGLVLTFVAAALLLLSHIFGVLSLGAVWVGEAVRTWRNRRLDPAVALTLLLPLVAAVTYAPMFHTFQGAMFPPAAQVTWSKLGFLYFAVFRWMWRPLLVILIFAAIFLRRRARVLARVRSGKYRAISYSSFVAGSPDQLFYSRYPRAMQAVLACLFLVPFAITLLFMRSHGAFYDRYGMVAVIPITLVAPLLLSWGLRAASSTAFAAFSWIAVLLLLSTALRSPLDAAVYRTFPPRAAKKIAGMLTTSEHGPFRPWWQKLPVPEELQKERESAPTLHSLDSFYPDLPIVAADELTFVEMDHRESSLVRRLYYTYDREAETQISHRAAANSILKMQQFFPLRGTIEPYSSFIAEHKTFVVIGLWEHSGDWLLRKLMQDGATLNIVAQYQGYTDTDVYLVNFPQ